MSSVSEDRRKGSRSASRKAREENGHGSKNKGRNNEQMEGSVREREAEDEEGWKKEEGRTRGRGKDPQSLGWTPFPSPLNI